VAIDSGFVEARLRLGRVSGLLGNHDEALRLLRQVRADSRDARISYYAALFAGAEEQALGLLDDARRSYEAAAALYPRAQSPHFALALLAWQTGDSRDGLRVLEPAVRPGQLRSQVDDPWWEYFDGLGDNTAALFHTLLTDAERRQP
jgi:tetratricopeptide (TPR) repeat protein